MNAPSNSAPGRLAHAATRGKRHSKKKTLKSLRLYSLRYQNTVGHQRSNFTYFNIFSLSRKLGNWKSYSAAGKRIR